jgi:hypothetical protein
VTDPSTTPQSSRQFARALGTALMTVVRLRHTVAQVIEVDGLDLKLATKGASDWSAATRLDSTAWLAQAHRLLQLAELVFEATSEIRFPGTSAEHLQIASDDGIVAFDAEALEEFAVRIARHSRRGQFLVQLTPESAHN